MSDIFHAGISGARGRMGRAVSQVLDAREDVVVAARFDRGETPDLKLCDVIIDFSTPEASVDLAKACAERGGPALVIGSTGLSPEQDTELEAAAEKIAIVRSGNFSLGLNILIGLVEHAAQRLDGRDWDIEVLETHHRRKVDAPSGTALMLGEAAANGRGRDLEDLKTAPYDGITGPREPGKIGFASLRAGGVIGEHTVLFGSDDELLTLSHSAIDRSLFAKGAVAAAAWVRNRRPGLYDMQDVLGFRQA
ncbi:MULTISPECIES: 4-hydroxy-tetrahydrodipicolinate reductase [unclassified Brevundimonas]|uniref:4-hydroxy-tetrahydrodipicolinate reductase n=1 Tax=unclassified Brevundimonas TaxID=2622653 RepID=UPI000CFAAD6E|nr:MULTISPECIES: 4-hydroxy-tetrahydrodipicolinate reductase [unclassified Brevundimonas]PRA26644.1 4-hydroxy-tetrahydrodipicolinate reductase [Brevundimonas sp. MYb27]PQZ76333.1 4-hydroxy-tetrahydrodipicolinate reductase [Brevundimonas sp. MYb31]PRB12157.1 4-hydroxy-tetrahydrodipicolinate reductase [Brevundimonas sp. MYb52]PRB33060.1 4-hydroxy-tetrahydrodipicolinate reductase [Brevundimonas sp. MYb46]PRB45960.1 4-hydroxy-tetrahydrodipicolinate reductase [Brevundimonas sp. MYb33]